MFRIKECGMAVSFGKISLDNTQKKEGEMKKLTVSLCTLLLVIDLRSYILQENPSSELFTNPVPKSLLLKKC